MRSTLTLSLILFVLMCGAQIQSPKNLQLETSFFSSLCTPGTELITTVTRLDFCSAIVSNDGTRSALMISDGFRTQLDLFDSTDCTPNIRQSSSFDSQIPCTSASNRTLADTTIIPSGLITEFYSGTDCEASKLRAIQQETVNQCQQSGVFSRKIDCENLVIINYGDTNCGLELGKTQIDKLPEFNKCIPTNSTSKRISCTTSPFFVDASGATVISGLPATNVVLPPPTAPAKIGSSSFLSPSLMLLFILISCWIFQ